MPVSLREHLANLAAEGVAFEPYVRDHRGALVHPDGSPPHRSPARERARLAAYWEKLDPAHRGRVEELVESLPPMPLSCRLVVQVPARLERKYLPGFLRLFMEQRDGAWRPLPRKLYEVLVVENYSEGGERDETKAVVGRFKARWGDRASNIHCVSVAFDRDEPYPLTLSRRYAADVAVARVLARPSHLAPVYFAPEDADLMWVDPRQVWTQITTLDADAALDAVRGQQDRCPWIMCRNDLLMVLRRSWNFTEAYLSRRSLRPDLNPHWDFNWNRVVTSGWNTAVTADAFALINGYTPHRRMGEDVDLGERISCVRGRVDGGEFVPQTGTVARVGIRAEGSPRRWLLRVADDVEPYERRGRYRNFFSRRVLRKLRRSSYETLLAEASGSARIDGGNVGAFEDALSKDWKFTIRVRGGLPAAEAQFGFVMGMLGFADDDWAFDGDRLRIRAVDRIRRRLDRYRARWAGRRPVGFEPLPGRRGTRISWRSFAPPFVRRATTGAAP